MGISKDNAMWQKLQIQMNTFAALSGGFTQEQNI